MTARFTPLQLRRVCLRDIKCFTEVDLTFSNDSDKAPWSVIVGDNAAGKTALLRSIAIGLCDESSAAGLMKESEEGYIRRDSSSPGTITVELVDRDKPAASYNIETTITRVTADGATHEQLRQRTSPERDFPWDRIFACAYGMGRGTGATGDIPGYSVISAVYNLFSYGEGLQNPELTFLRTTDLEAREPWLRELAKILDIPIDGIRTRKRGMSLDGPWGDDMPLRDLADGYRATFLWVADFIGWALAFDKTLTRPQAVRGIVLIDELEQHLHVTWQRRVVDQLRAAFPGVQFIATTHSPFIAASVGPLRANSLGDSLIVCELDPESHQVIVEPIPTMQAYRFDQVLASRAFKYLIECDPALEDAVARASLLQDRGPNRTPAEEKEYAQLKEKLRGSLFLRATSSIERELQAQRLDELKQREKDANNHDTGGVG